MPPEEASPPESMDSFMQKMKNGEPPSAEEAEKWQSHVTAASSAQNQAADFQTQASKAADPEQRKSLMGMAADWQMKSITENEKLQMLAKGWQQGAVAGGGAGVATGMGLGNVVGGVLSLPTGLVGTAVGAGVGAVAGPIWEVPTKEEEEGKKE